MEEFDLGVTRYRHVQSGADVNVSGVATVGMGGTGAMTIAGSGSSFTNANANIYVGNSAGSNGLFTLSNSV